MLFLTQRREGARRFWAGAVDERGWKVSKVVRVFKVTKGFKVSKDDCMTAMRTVDSP